MSDQQPQTTEVIHWTTPPWLRMITENFAVISTAGLLIGIVSATVFLYAYLGVFDPQLLWIIEYPDILKFGLVAIAVVGILFVLLVGFLPVVVQTVRASKERKKILIMLSVGVFIISIAVTLIYEWSRSEPHYIRVMWIYCTMFSVFALAYLATNIYDSGGWPSFSQVVGLLVVVMALDYSYGATWGWKIRATITYQYDVHLKDQSLLNVRLVLTTSHHTVLYMGQTALVVPTSDVLRIVSNPSDQK